MIDYKKIKSRRIDLQMTQDEAAKRAGFLLPDGTGHRQRWCDLESGRIGDVNASTLRSIAKAIRMPMESLLIEPTAKS